MSNELNSNANDLSVENAVEIIRSLENKRNSNHSTYAYYQANAEFYRGKINSLDFAIAEIKTRFGIDDKPNESVKLVEVI